MSASVTVPIAEWNRLNDRVKALEDWQQALARVFLAPPTPQPVKSPAQLANENTTKEKDAQQDPLMSKFLPDQREHLVIKNGGIYLNKYLQHGWDEINDQATALGFHWVKAGKDSHWSR